MKKGGKKLEKRRFVVIVIGWLLVRPLFVEDALTNLHTTPFIGSIINIQTHWALLSLSLSLLKTKLQAIIDAPLKRLSPLSQLQLLACTHTHRQTLQWGVFFFPNLSPNRQSKALFLFVFHTQWAVLLFILLLLLLHRSRREGEGHRSGDSFFPPPFFCYLKRRKTLKRRWDSDGLCVYK